MTYEVKCEHRKWKIMHELGIYDNLLAAEKCIRKATIIDMIHGEAGEYNYYINDEYYC